MGIGNENMLANPRSGSTGPTSNDIFASFINFAAQFVNAELIPMRIGGADDTGNIVLSEPPI